MEIEDVGGLTGGKMYRYLVGSLSTLKHPTECHALRQHRNIREAERERE